MKKLLRIVSALLVFTLCFAPSARAESDLHASIRTLLSTAMQDRYYYEIEGNESGYVIRISDEGISSSVLLTAYGVLPRDFWQEYIDSTIAYANTIAHFINECGAESDNLLLLVVDDYEFDTVLLAIYNGVVIYDYAPAK